MPFVLQYKTDPIDDDDDDDDDENTHL